jgi:hypothetical protein
VGQTIAVIGLVKPNKRYWKSEIRQLGGTVKEMKQSKGQWPKGFPDLVVTCSESVRTNTGCIIHCRKAGVPLISTQFLAQVKALRKRISHLPFVLEHELYPDQEADLVSTNRELHRWGNLGTEYIRTYQAGVDFDDRTEYGRVRKTKSRAAETSHNNENRKVKRPKVVVPTPASSVHIVSARSDISQENAVLGCTENECVTPASLKTHNTIFRELEQALRCYSPLPLSSYNSPRSTDLADSHNFMM